MLAEASRACREICPGAKIIIHTDRSGDAETLRRYYLRLESANMDYDIIGLSYYPFWHGTFTDVSSALTLIGHLFPQKEIMFVEVAYPYNEWGYPSDSKYPALYPATPQGQADFTKAFIAFLGSYPQVTGLFWWFAEETYSPGKKIHPDMHRGLFHNRTGKALPALDELKTFMY
jgi:arabinogalactan endo-1,4-beta-galactosidase